jgi:lactate racemase
MRITLPYGSKNLDVSIPKGNLLDIIQSHELTSSNNPTTLIETALQNPLGTGKLGKIAKTGDSVAIVVDDHTRPLPSKILLPPVLQILEDAGVTNTDITIIIGTGTHQAPSFETIGMLLGEEIIREYSVMHTDQDASTFVNVGTSSYHHDIEVLKEYVQADIKIIISDIEYHYFAGFGGTRKSILPAIASKRTIQMNHAMMFDKYATTGSRRKNPINIEMEESMMLAGCDFSLSCVLNSQHQIVGAWAGDPEQVMDEGVKLVDNMYKSTITKKPDIVLVAADGSPHDINLYQALKALYTAAQVVKKNGWIILVAECAEGMGSNLYQEWLQRYQTAEEIKKALEDDFKIGAHKAYYHRQAVETCTIGLISTLHKSFVKNLLGFHPFSNPQQALDHALQNVGSKAQVLVIPNGTTSHVRLSRTKK